MRVRGHARARVWVGAQIYEDAKVSAEMNAKVSVRVRARIRVRLVLELGLGLGLGLGLE